MECATLDELVRTEACWPIQRQGLHTFGSGSGLAIGRLPRILQLGNGEALYQAGDSWGRP